MMQPDAIDIGPRVLVVTHLEKAHGDAIKSPSLGCRDDVGNCGRDTNALQLVLSVKESVVLRFSKTTHAASICKMAQVCATACCMEILRLAHNAEIIAHSAYDRLFTITIEAPWGNDG